MPWIFRPEVIRLTRDNLGFSASRFGREMVLPMSGAQILDIEAGRRGLTVTTLLRICNHYDVSPLSFFEHVGKGFTGDQPEVSSSRRSDSRSRPRGRGTGRISTRVTKQVI